MEFPFVSVSLLSMSPDSIVLLFGRFLWLTEVSVPAKPPKILIPDLAKNSFFTSVGLGWRYHSHL